MKYTTINIQGNLISEEILQKIEQSKLEKSELALFGVENATDLRNEMEYVWSRMKLDWTRFWDKSQKLPASDPYGTNLCRKWMSDFFSTLGFELQKQTIALTGENSQSYSISHTATNLDDLPLHLVGFYEAAFPNRNTLDHRASGGSARLSPHATVQEYLNVTEHLYGIISNGFSIRLLRDSGRLVKFSYIEFDLKRMFEEEKYNEFTLIYRLLHASRFPKNRQESEKCLLEQYYQEGIESGNRIREGLSSAVKESLTALGRGFLQHEKNAALRQKLQNAQITSKDLHRQLLRLIYRFLFLMVTEERDLVYNPAETNEEILRKKQVYDRYYSLSRLRKMSQNRSLQETQFSDLWLGLMQTFQLFEESGYGKPLGIFPLAGELFNSNAIQDLADCHISNALLLECVRNLNEFIDEKKNRVRINYRSLDVEELGSVYEGLLELHPVITDIQARNAQHIGFSFREGTDRKTTGSYYTRPDLVNELIKTALIPVIEQRLAQHRNNKAAKIKALLDLKVCDAAAGSGHILLAAARSIAWYLAKEQSNEENPSPSVFRAALREVIQHCIYAVDYNADAVELCKLALWLESHDSGKPLSFLDHKIRNGNSLVGVTNLSILQKGIPDEAFTAVTGDDKEVCRVLKKQNALFNKKQQLSIQFEQGENAANAQLTKDFLELGSIAQNDIASVKQVKSKFEQLRNNCEWLKEWTACNIWTAAFFFDYTQQKQTAAPNSERLKLYLETPSAAYAPMIGEVNALSVKQKFFHWCIEFPDVFAQGGFDVMLGNPPWEKIKLEEQQFFATRSAAIANAKNKSERGKLIKNLPISSPKIWKEYQDAVHETEASSKFIRNSKRFELSAVGDINTYLLFTELAYRNRKDKKGRVGLIIPIGLVAESSSQDFFNHLTNANAIESFYGFINSKKIFADIKDYIKFGLLTLGYSEKPNFAFWLTDVSQITDTKRVFTITKDEIKTINPNTKTCPIFRTNIDAAVTKKVFRNTRILDSDFPKKEEWNPKFNRVFDMSNDSGEFQDNAGEGLLPLYEAKMIWNYDHRFSTYENATEANINEGNLPQLTPEMHADSNKVILPRYFVTEESLSKRVGNWKRKWFLVFRGIAATNNERTFIYAIVPYIGAGNSAPAIIFPESLSSLLITCFFANTNALTYDYIGRQKAAGSNLNFYIIRQMPVLQRNDYTTNLITAIVPRVLELTYTAWDIKAFGDDVWKESSPFLKVAIRKQWEANQAETGGHEWNPPAWCDISEEGIPLPPFKWSEERRAKLKAELDAIYADMYGLDREELRYILDPQEVYGDDFPGETFRVLKEKEIRKYGEYRTKRLVLAAWDEYQAAKLAETASSLALQNAIYTGENKNVEFKSSYRWDTKNDTRNDLLEYEIFKTITAFLNSDGGDLFIGLTDEGKVYGLEKDLTTFDKGTDGILLLMDSRIESWLKNRPLSQFIRTDFYTFEGKLIAKVSVKPAHLPVYCKYPKIDRNKTTGVVEVKGYEPTFFVRSQASSPKLNAAEIEIYIKGRWG